MGGGSDEKCQDIPIGFEYAKFVVIEHVFASHGWVLLPDGHPVTPIDKADIHRISH